MTPKQRSAVISLNHEKRKAENTSNGNDNNTTVTRQLSALQADLVTLGEAIVAGVTRGANEDVSVITNDPPVPTTNTNDTTQSNTGKRKATSGGVGEFIRRHRQNP